MHLKKETFDMAKTITDQIAALQLENDRLKKLQKLFEKAVKDEFGVDTKTIHKRLGNSSDFEAKIATYFDLKTPQDFEDFLAVFCSETSLNYFKNHRRK